MTPRIQSAHGTSETHTPSLDGLSEVVSTSMALTRITSRLSTGTGHCVVGETLCTAHASEVLIQADHTCTSLLNILILVNHICSVRGTPNFHRKFGHQLRFQRSGSCCTLGLYISTIGLRRHGRSYFITSGRVPGCICTIQVPRLISSS